MPDQFTEANHPGRGTDDASLEGTDGDWWDEFFSDRSPPIPFFRDRPDENLAEWFSSDLIAPGRALEFGCGNGRNALYLASPGCTVDAVDFSAQAITWVRERAVQAAAEVTFQCCSIFDAEIETGSYCFVYDAGCFHHLHPHQRAEYVGPVARALRPNSKRSSAASAAPLAGAPNRTPSARRRPAGCCVADPSNLSRLPPRIGCTTWLPRTRCPRPCCCDGAPRCSHTRYQGCPASALLEGMGAATAYRFRAGGTPKPAVRRCQTRPPGSANPDDVHRCVPLASL